MTDFVPDAESRRNRCIYRKKFYSRKGEFQSVCQAVGGAEKLIDEKCKDKDLLALVKYLADEQKPEKIFENQKIIKLPIVRNGKRATVGYQPEVSRVARAPRPQARRGTRASSHARDAPRTEVENWD